MKIGRAVSLIVVLAGLSLRQAAAQSGGMPATPSSPGLEAPLFTLPPACQHLVALRDEAQKQAGLIQSANQRKAKPAAQEVCKLFRTFLETEARMMKAFADFGPQCGVPSQTHAQIKDGHAHARQIAAQVCEAARGLDRRPPTMDDRLMPQRNAPARISDHRHKVAMME